MLASFTDLLPDAQVVGWGLGGGTSEFESVDLCDRQAVQRAVSSANPTHVLHLAAVSNVPESFRDPIKTWQTNVMGTAYLVESLALLDSHPSTIFVSTADVYGESFRLGKVDENSPLQPMNPYAASKAAGEMMIRQLVARGLPYVIARPFNHFGSEQARSFALPGFAHKVVVAVKTGKSEISVGNVSTQRDFLHVENVVSAYATILQNFEKLNGRTLNICSGVSRVIADVIDELIALAGARLVAKIDPELVRETDIPLVACDPSEALLELGWSPEFDMRKGLLELLEEARRG